MAPNVVTFSSKKNKYKSLSNFWDSDVSIVDNDSMSGFRTYSSGEHCFHGEKYIRVGELCDDDLRKQKLIAYGETFIKPSVYETAVEAKKRGGKKGLLLSEAEIETWTKLCIDVQREICRWKYDNDMCVRNDLQDSGAKPLVHSAMRCRKEDLHKKFWEGKAFIEDDEIVILGKNALGNIWMDFRNA
jgi:hypothetical protein